MRVAEVRVTEVRVTGGKSRKTGTAILLPHRDCWVKNQGDPGATPFPRMDPGPSLASEHQLRLPCCFFYLQSFSENISSQSSYAACLDKPTSDHSFLPLSSIIHMALLVVLGIHDNSADPQRSLRRETKAQLGP